MYTEVSYKTKKALKDAVKAWNEYAANPDMWRLEHMSPMSIGAVMGRKVEVPYPVRLFAPGLGTPKTNGTEYVEGPHYPLPHTWYAGVEVLNGTVIKVR